jgi:uncharacterized repeat protein (TIGR02543 family)
MFYIENTSFNINKNIIVTAQWTANTYTITYNANGGKIIDSSGYEYEISNIEIKYDSIYGELPEVKRDGYKFLGWFDAKNDGNEIKSDSLVKKPNNHTIYAQWEKIPESNDITSSCFIYSEENGEKKWI